MPSFNNETLDDPILFDPCASFSGGQVSNTRANLIGQNQAAALVNCDLLRNGQVVTRRGTRGISDGSLNGDGLPVQGITYCDFTGSRWLVACAGGNLWHQDGENTGAWSPLGAGVWHSGEGPHVSFALGNDHLYFSSRQAPLGSWDGNTVLDLTLAPTTVGSPPVAIATNQRPPDYIKLLVWHTSRLVAAVGDQIYFSAFLNGAVWDKANWQIRVGGGDGEGIAALVPWTGFKLAVLKRRSIWTVDCNPTAAVADFVVAAVHRDLGCVAERSAVQVGSDVWFLSQTGVRSLSRVLASDTQAEVGEPLSAPVQDIIDRITPDWARNACAIAWQNRYLLAIPLDGSQVNNYVLVYNLLTGSWSGVWTGWQPTQFAVSNYFDKPRLVYGQPDGTVHEWLDWVARADEDESTYQDTNRAYVSGQWVNVPADVSTQLFTRALTFNDPLSPKTGLNVEIEFDGSGPSVTLNAVRDDGDAEALATFATAPAVGANTDIVRRAFDLMHLAPFRELQFEMTTTGGKLVLRQLVASGFVNTMILQH